MRLGLLVSLLIVALVAIGCGGSDKGGFFSGSRSSNANAGADGNAVPPDAKAVATAIAQGSNNPGNLPAGNTAATPDPCALLTLDDAATVLKSKDLKKGKDVSVPNNPLGSRECSYEAQGGNFSSISLTVMSTAGFSPQVRSSGYNVKKQFEELKRLKKNPVAVKGIGDDAFTDGRFIHVLKKDVTFDLLIFMGGGDPTDALKAAATRIAAKLP